MNTSNKAVSNDSLTPNAYAEELNMQLKHMFDQVIEKLQISRQNEEAI